jgi:hypothetical protein
MKRLAHAFVPRRESGWNRAEASWRVRSSKQARQDIATTFNLIDLQMVNHALIQQHLKFL